MTFQPNPGPPRNGQGGDIPTPLLWPLQGRDRTGSELVPDH